MMYSYVCKSMACVMVHTLVIIAKTNMMKIFTPTLTVKDPFSHIVLSLFVRQE